jgi:guanylate kinase
MKKGLLIILSGPSGVGKGTVRKYIMKRNVLDLTFSISMTTREPRAAETNGVEYYFVSREEFQKNIDNDNFLEWAEFVGNRYGTPKSYVEELRNQGKNVILEIEINGAEQVLKKVKDDRVISFFLKPPSLKQLEERIRKRKSENEETIQKRLNKGKAEMEKAKNYDFIILNDRIKRAGEEIISIIKQFDAQ